MAKKTEEQVQEPTATPPATQPVVEQPAATGDQAAPPPRPPQGITIRYMSTGNPGLDFHRKHRKIRKIDPASLIVDGKPPVLALPRDGEAGKAFKRVGAEHAADLLVCDFVSGGPSVYRLATDAEVEAYEAELAARAANKGIPVQK